MRFSALKTAALSLATAGLAISMPASATTLANAADWTSATPAYGDLRAEHGKDHRDRGKHRGRYNRGNSDYGYSAYRTPVRSRAQSYYSRYPTNYGEPVYRNTRVWEGDDGRYYCRRSNGTTGLLVGAGVGALLGREVAGRGGDRTLGAILGAAGGALLGRSLDSGTRCG